MLIEIRKKNQITLPLELMKQLNLKEGDVLNIEASSAINSKPGCDSSRKIYKVESLKRLTLI